MISVCIATYNGGKYIKDELLSIIPQLHENDEIIISDDGSSDDTIAQVESLKDSRIKVFNNTRHDSSKKPGWNVTKNFENALIHANGDYVFLADQDDIWMPNKINVCLNALSTNDLIIHEMALFIGDNLEDLHKNHWNGKFHFRNFLLSDGKYFGCSMAFKRKVLDWSLPFPNDLLLHDYWIGIMAELCGKVSFISEPLIKYRLHGGNVSLVSPNSFIEKIWYRLYIILNYINKFIKVKIKNRLCKSQY